MLFCYFIDEIAEGGSWVGGLHEVLADEESVEAGGDELSYGLRIADATLADLAGIVREELCEAEGVFYLGDEGAEVAVVDSAHVRLEVGIFKLGFAMHLKEHLKPEVVGLMKEVTAFCLCEAFCYE